MHSLRFEDIGIYITEKVVQYCGRFQTRSKKRVKWTIQSPTNKHEIFCTISFSSGKKKVVHNGFVIQQLKDSSDSLNAIINIGEIKMIIMIDQTTQMIRPKLQLKSNLDKKDQFKAFKKFKNIYSD